MAESKDAVLDLHARRRPLPHQEVTPLIRSPELARFHLFRSANSVSIRKLLARRMLDGWVGIVGKR
jgi:hypothetical protein